ncbi:NAD-dependent epimerase/dehydratase family protein [Terrarubrum flagellatum]|uniref:NAD-dependent epimerase/dehydratase family protein n=1 Tax=Terrirubrum flagellatum TaxID=2895980 RepID=UPI003144DA62
MMDGTDRRDQESPTRRVLVTGASGFVGGAIARHLHHSGWRVRVAARRPTHFRRIMEEVAVGDLREAVDWAAALEGCDAVVHAAGLAHQPRGVADSEMFRINAEATGALARAARSAGITRFVFISSVRAIAGASSDVVIDDHSPWAPTDAYGRSKLEGEATALASGVPTAILRPTAVCGASARGAFALMAQMAQAPMPIPARGLRGRRSFVTDRNLADAARALLVEERAAGGRFLVAEPRPFTAEDFIVALRAARGARPNIAPLPRFAIAIAARLPRLGDMIERLDRDFIVECPALTALGWKPVEPSEKGLARMIDPPVDTGGW